MEVLDKKRMAMFVSQFPCALISFDVFSGIAKLGYYVGGVLIAILTVLLSIFHKQIVNFLTPAANWMHE